MTSQTKPATRRRWWRTAVRWLAIAAAAIPISILLLILWENWRGREAWQRAVAEARAAGEPVELAQVIPPPAADNQNFAAIPLFQPLFDYVPGTPGPPYHVFGVSTGISGGNPQWRDPAAKERIDEMHLPYYTGLGNWQKGTFVDLKEWQQDLLGTNRADSTSVRNVKNAPQWQMNWLRGLKPADHNATPGVTVLSALAVFNPELDALRDAAKRPRARFPIDYNENIPSMTLPHLTAIQQFSAIARLRTLAELSLGKTDEACQDQLLGFALAEAPREEPLVISQLVRIGAYEMLMQSLWEGLARRQWNDVQLASLDAALQHPDFIQSFQQTFRGERVFMIKTMDDIVAHSNLPGRFVTFGWLDLNKALLFRTEGELFRSVDPNTHRVFPKAIDRLFDDFNRDTAAHPIAPGRILASIAFPGFSGIPLRTAVAQEHIDLARVAIALERYRLAHGTWPANLDDLSAVFLSKVPNDIATGEPLHYRRDADGGFTLYSVGWNCIDEGSKVAFQRSNPTRIDWKNGDWVWPKYPKDSPTAGK